MVDFVIFIVGWCYNLMVICLINIIDGVVYNRRWMKSSGLWGNLYCLRVDYVVIVVFFFVCFLVFVDFLLKVIEVIFIVYVKMGKCLGLDWVVVYMGRVIFVFWVVFCNKFL